MPFSISGFPKAGLCLMLSLVMLAQGCAVRPPSQQEQSAVQQKQKSIVFLHLKFLLDDQPYNGIGRHEIFSLKLARTETGKAAQPAPSISPSWDAKKENWLYFVLEPGLYCLSVMNNPNSRHAKKIQDFWLEVDRDRPLTYGGTLVLKCEKMPLFIKRCTQVAVADEYEDALKFAAASFADYGEPFPGLVQPVEQVSPAARGQDLMPLGVVATCGANLVSPQWVRRGAGWSGETDNSPPGGFLAVGGAYPPQGAGALAAGILLFAAAASAVGAIHGKVLDKRFQPCIQELIQELQKMDMAAILGRELGDQLGKYSQAAPVLLPPEKNFYPDAARKGLKTVLQTDLRRIQIRECRERGTFCLEILLWGHIWEVSSRKSLRHLALVYSSVPESPEGKDRLPTVQTWKPSTCRKMEAYCGPEGRQIFQEEIQVGLHYLVEKLVFELGLLQRAPVGPLSSR